MCSLSKAGRNNNAIESNHRFFYITKNSIDSYEAGMISILQRKIKNGTMDPETITNDFNFIFFSNFLDFVIQ